MAGRDTLRKKLPPEISCCQYITIVGSGGFDKKNHFQFKIFYCKLLSIHHHRRALKKKIIFNTSPSLEVGELIRKSFSI